MPAWVLASPAVVMVCTPCRKVMSSFGIGAGSQRNCAIGNSYSWHGAVRHNPASAFANRPECLTAGCGEGRAGELFGVEAIGAALRRIAPDRQRPGQRLGLKAVAKAGHVARRDADGASRDRIGRGVD